MKKFLIKVLIGILCLFIVSRIYFAVMLLRLVEAIEDFKIETNTYYKVEIKNGVLPHKEEVFKKDDIVNYIVSKGDSQLNCEWRNLKTGEMYDIDMTLKEIYKSDILIENQNFLPNLPSFIVRITDSDKIDLGDSFKIIYIIPTEYENQKVYKIRTKSEIILIDRNTKLPVYATKKITNTENGQLDSIGYDYKFEVGNVTEKAIELPDLSEYVIRQK